MPFFRSFSQRQQDRANAGKPVLFQTKTLPQAFRVQVIHILVRTFGEYVVQTYARDRLSTELWDILFTVTRERLGVFHLTDDVDNSFEQCRDYIVGVETPQVIDVIESAARLATQNRVQIFQANRVLVEDSISELNERFKEHKIGFQFAGGMIIPFDSTYNYVAITEPALTLLHEDGFQGALDEFLRAYRFFRSNDYKQANVEALKAVESTLKTICTRKHWAFSEKDAAKDLIATVFREGLIRPYLQSYFTGLRSMLESGVPTVRNREGGHGQGPDIIEVPEHYASFCLNTAATCIQFLIQESKR
jgi:hypothetical protein